jgi:hypothetical protein
LYIVEKKDAIIGEWKQLELALYLGWMEMKDMSLHSRRKEGDSDSEMFFEFKVKTQPQDSP